MSDDATSDTRATGAAGSATALLDLVKNNVIATAVIVVLILIIVFLMYRPSGEKKKEIKSPDADDVEEFENLISEINDSQK